MNVIFVRNFRFLVQVFFFVFVLSLKSEALDKTHDWDAHTDFGHMLCHPVLSHFRSVVLSKNISGQSHKVKGWWGISMATRAEAPKLYFFSPLNLAEVWLVTVIRWFYGWLGTSSLKPIFYLCTHFHQHFYPSRCYSMGTLKTCPVEVRILFQLSTDGPKAH